MDVEVDETIHSQGGTTFTDNADDDVYGTMDRPGRARRREQVSLHSERIFRECQASMDPSGFGTDRTGFPALSCPLVASVAIVTFRQTHGSQESALVILTNLVAAFSDLPSVDISPTK